MRVVRYRSFGGPEVLEIEEGPDPAPGDGEVLLAITASGINPADVNQMTGNYGTRPELPTTPGFEAAGRVLTLGPGVEGVSIGDRVMVPLGGLGRQGAWRDRAVVRASRLFPTPERLSDSQAGSVWVVYLTAWAAMLDVLQLQSGDSLIVTAAGSAVGRAAAQIAGPRGIRLIGTVRRLAAIDEVKQLGYEEVVVSPGEDLAERVRTITDGKGATAALDAVAGETGSACLQAIRNGGSVVVYGRLSGDPIVVDPSRLLFGQTKLQGFWLTPWLGSAGRDKLNQAYAELLGGFASGELVPPVDREFPLEAVQDACRWIRESGRQGKVVLTSPAP